jgi:predicted RNA-binding Zn ribbon-like protein
VGKKVTELSQENGTGDFIFVGNYLCLDFINTQIVENGEPKDLLKQPEDLIEWARGAKLISSSEAKTIKNSWSKKAEASELFQRVKKFRGNLREAMEYLAHGGTIKPGTIKMINSALRQSAGFTEIRLSDNGFEKAFRFSFMEPSQILAPVSESAADLLCYGNPAFLKKCENSACVLYFYDTSKNHRRRWCSMAGCGNRAKAAAFYYRRKETN